MELSIKRKHSGSSRIPQGGAGKPYIVEGIGYNEI